MTSRANRDRNETRRQLAILDAAERRYSTELAAEIKRAMIDAAVTLERTGQEPGEMLEHHRAMTDIFTDMISATIRAFGWRVFDAAKSAGITVETKLSFEELFHMAAVAYIGQEAVRQRITNISNTTRGQIIAIVREGHETGIGNAAIARLIHDRAPSISRVRSRMIARTETHGAANAGTLYAAKQAPIPMVKRWSSGDDARVRPHHVEAHGQVRALDQPFIVDDERLNHPGDPNGSGGNVINCRCVMLFDVPDLTDLATFERVMGL